MSTLAFIGTTLIFQTQLLEVRVDTKQIERNMGPVRPLKNRPALAVINLLDALIYSTSRVPVPKRIRFRLGLIRRRNTHSGSLAPGSFAAAGDLITRLPSGQPSDIVQTPDGPLPLQFITEL